MREKINLQELTALLSDKAGITKKEADAFLRDFFGLMTDALIEDKIVKIRDLGTFKLTEVEARESVNVRTGERFLIAAHPKVSFIPDKTLNEITNRPYEHLKPEVIEEKVSEVTEEKVSEIIEEEVSEVIEEKVSEVIEEKENLFKENIVIEYADETIQRKKKKIKTVVFTFLTVGLLITAFYFLIKEDDTSITGSHHATVSNKSALHAPTENKAKNNPDGYEIKLNDKDTIVVVNPVDTVAPIKNTWLPGKKRKTGVGQRLTMISYEEYGDVVFWIYIYEENKHLIGKDNYLKAGIEITIPPPEKYGIDAKDPRSVQKARDFDKNHKNNLKK